MAEFVDKDRDGVDLMPLPGRCRLVSVPPTRGSFAKHRWHLFRPYVDEVSLGYPALHGVAGVSVADWARHPPAISVFRALRWIAPTSEVQEWAAIRDIADGEDVAWFRKRRTGLGSPHRMNVSEIMDAIGTLTREMSEREHGKKPRPYDLRVNGVSVYDLKPDQLADLSVAIDWHLGAPGRQEALAEVIEPVMERVGQLSLPLGKRR